MSTALPTRAPLLLEKLSSEKLLETYCHDPTEDVPILALWERLTDRNDPKSILSELKRKSKYICPRGSDPNWIFLGSITRAYYRFKKYACGYRGRLDTPAFEAFKRWIMKCSVIDEYRFEKGPKADLFEQLGNLGLDIDDTGRVIKSRGKEDAELYDEINEARQEDEEQLLDAELADGGGDDGDAE